jgi:hypothetical protein
MNKMALMIVSISKAMTTQRKNRPAVTCCIA